MRGQVGIEFVISVGLFLIVLIYSVSTILGIIPAFWEESKLMEANSLSFQFSQQLLFSENFTEGPYVLNESKLSRDNNEIRSILGLENTTTFGFRVTDMEGNEKIGKNVDKFEGGAQRTALDRMAIMNDKIVRLRVFIG